ncbi:MAG: hypothetical protein JWN41_272 [Thermoleophilia bacterium]|nr:hypothetical protein [Thermoleophilia bacterium]
MTHTDATPATARRIPELPRRLVLAAFLVAFVMIPVGLFLSAVGIWVLDASGGAARDTSLVVAVAAFVVTDFWGGGILAALTRARAAQVTIVWGVARCAYLLVIALVATHLALLLPIQLVLALPAAWVGARASRKQAHLRAHVQRQKSREQLHGAAPDPR